MAFTLGHTIPILRAFDEAKTRDFYVDFLEFEVDFEARFEPGLPLYMQIHKDDCVLHITEHHGDGCPGCSVYVAIKGIDEYQQRLLAKQYKHYRPGIEEPPWGGREMTVKDGCGNRLTFFER